MWLKLDLKRKLAYLAFILLVLAYPGQNFYQTLFPHSSSPLSLPQLITPPIRPTFVGHSYPHLTAFAAVAQDVDSKTMLFLKNPNLRLYPASTTKIMTALVALDYYRDLAQTITINNESQAIGHTMGLKQGEVITVKALLYGLLVESGNDAALALANNYDGGYDAFVAAMNTKARQLGLKDTSYKNPSGVEQAGHLTTARDLAILASHAVQNPIFNQIMQTKAITFTDQSGKIIHSLQTTNKLLGVLPGVKGVKTGWTQNAGECLVTYVDREGKKIITVVLKSQDRFGETARLINWIFANYQWL